MILHTKVADRLFTFSNNNSTYRSRLFKVFKIKSKSISSQDNFISDSSLQNLCYGSKDSLEEICIRNAHKLSNPNLINCLTAIQSLQKLDLSYCKQIDDEVITSICSKLTNLVSLSVRFLDLLTSESLNQIFVNLKNL